MPFLIALILFAAYIAYRYSEGKKKLQETGVYMGADGMRMAIIWERSPMHRRVQALESIGIEPGLSQVALLDKSWIRLPLPVQVSLTRMLQAAISEAAHSKP